MNECLSDAQRLADAINGGGVVLYPTDTVWGLGCRADDPAAVAHIFNIKQRPDAKALITLVDSQAMLEAVAGPLAPEVAALALAERPTTVVYPHPRGLAPGVTAPDGSAAIRLTRDPYCRALIAAVGAPVVSTSANRSGAPAPAVWADIDPAILGAVSAAARWRRDESVNPNAPSRVIKLGDDGAVTVLRP